MSRVIANAAELPREEWLKFKQVAERFEDAWQAGRRPSIDDCLPAGEPARRLALRELVHTELEYRLKAGEPARVEEYLHRYPSLRSDPEAVLALAEAEYELRRRREPGVTPADYLRRFPECGPELAARQVTPPGEGEQPWTGPLPGRTLAKVDAPRPSVPGYEVVEEVGRGGMGVVYKARQLSLNRFVALKMILAGEHAGPEQRARFRGEAEMIAQLQHPNVVQVYEVGEHDGRPFLALEFVEGGNLAQKLRGAPQPARAAAGLVETLARAVQAAHRRGVVHRDLTPANVLLTPDGVPKVTDFGLAKCLDGAPGGPGALASQFRTQSGAILGTPAYMAPEQATGRPKDISPRTDVYALGAILYELLTGRPPFQAPSVLETLEQVRVREPVPPGRRHPVPRDLETVCLKCLEKDPARRYPSAEALADELRRFLDGQPIQARTPSRWQRAFRWARHRPGVAAALLLLLLILPLGLGNGPRPTPAPPEGAPPAGPPAGPLTARAPASPHGLKAELFQGANFERHVRTRIDGPVDWLWGLGAPDPDMQPDNFTVRWTGWLKAPRPGRYQLITVSDDGVRLWLDGKLLIDKWRRQMIRRYEAGVDLTDRPHALRIEYLELLGNALMSFRWAQPDGCPEQVVPAEALFHDRAAAEKTVVPPLAGKSPRGGHGLRAELYRGQDFGHALGIRIDPHVDWTWAEGYREARPDDLAIRWTGWLKAPKPGRYKLVLIAGNCGARLWLGGELRVNQWHVPVMQRYPVEVELTREPQPIRIDFYKNPTDNEHTTISLRWEQRGGFHEQVIPARALFHDRAAAGR